MNRRRDSICNGDGDGDGDGAYQMDTAIFLFLLVVQNNLYHSIFFTAFTTYFEALFAVVHKL